MSDAATFRYPIWARGDLDGFFGLMVDNLVQVLLIVALCTSVAGIPADFIFARVLPGVLVIHLDRLTALGAAEPNRHREFPLSLVTPTSAILGSESYSHRCGLSLTPRRGRLEGYVTLQAAWA